MKKARVTCVVVMGALYVGLPTNKVAGLLGLAPSAVWPTLYLSLGLLGLLTLGLCFAEKPWASATRTSFKPKTDYTKKILVAQLALSGLILAQALYGTFAYVYETDELWILSQIQQGAHWKYTNPFFGPSHTLTTAFTALSYRLFGLNALALRGISLALTLALLLGLNRYGRRLLLPTTLLLVLAHLACNPQFLWFTHDFRGYLSLILASGLVFFVYAESQSSKSLRLWPLVAGLVLCWLSHAYGLIFCLALCGAALGNSWLTHGKLSLEKLGKFERAILVWSVVCVGLLLLFRTQQAQLITNDVPFSLPAILQLFGIGNETVGRLAQVLVLSVLLFAFPRKGSRGFLALLLLLSGGLILFAIYGVLGTRQFRSPYLFPFLIPALIFLGDSIARAPNRALRISLWAMTVACLVIGPLFAASGFIDVYESQKPFLRFMDQVKAETLGPEGRCVVISGNFVTQEWARLILDNDRPPCRRRFLLHAGHSDEPVPHGARLVFESAEIGGALYRLD